MVRPDHKKPLAPSFLVSLNGEKLEKDVAGWIVSIVVEDDLDVPSMFSFELCSKEDMRGTAPWTDTDLFVLGAEIVVSMGYGDRLEPLISGEITALEPSFRRDGPPTLMVRGYDRRHRLNGARRTRAFVNDTDSGIAEQICADVNVDIFAIDSRVQHAYVLQAGQTNLQFLIERARRIQYELAMDGDELQFRPVGNTVRPANDAVFTFTDDLIEFHPRLSLVPVTKTQLFFWDVKDPKKDGPPPTTATQVDRVGSMEGAQGAAQFADAVFKKFADPEQTTENDIDAPISSQAEADQLARARFAAASLDLIQGEGSCFGSTGVRAGETIRFEKLGKRFTGNYYVTSAVHSYTRRDGYLTQFRVRRSES